MLSLLSTTSRSIRPCIWTSLTRPFSFCSRASQSSNQSAEEDAAHQQALERKRKDRDRYRHRYQIDPVFRQKEIDRSKKAIRAPETRARNHANDAQYYIENRETILEQSARYYIENLETRRSNNLDTFMSRPSWKKKGYVWKTHTPIVYPERVDHHCTSCDRVRLLKRWWREKSSEADRYMCNRCFANSWEFVVPESYRGELPLLFTSPTHPPPPARKEGSKITQNKGKKNGECEEQHQHPDPPR